MKKFLAFFAICAAAVAYAGDVGFGLSAGLGSVGSGYTPSAIPGALMTIGVAEDVDLVLALGYHEYYCNKSSRRGYEIGVDGESIFAATAGFSWDALTLGRGKIGPEGGAGVFATDLRYTDYNDYALENRGYRDTETAPGLYAGIHYALPLFWRFQARCSALSTLVKNYGEYSDSYYPFQKTDDDLVFSLNVAIMGY